MRFIFDLDDTISVHYNRDFENAKPIPETIEKIRKLKQDGIEIVIYSSRGQNSCKGDLELIEKKNREQIETWLANHDVPYDQLVFGKPLGDIYVDDKGVNLKDFLEQDYCRLEGNSGSLVYRAGDRIIKQCKDARQQADWYKKANEIGINTPKVISVVLNTITMENVPGEAGNVKELNDRELGQIFSQILLMGMYKGEPFDVDGYIAFIKERLAIAGWENEFDRLIEVIEQNREFLISKSSFSHGDLSLSNMIFDNGKLTLIDPSHRTEYSIYHNDFAKVRFSLNGGEQLLHGGERPEEYDWLLKDWTTMVDAFAERQLIRAMEAVHWIRMLGYFKGPKECALIWNKAKELEAEL